MSQDEKRYGLVLAIILVLYNIIIFVAPFTKTSIFWVTYLFTLVSFIVAGVAIYFGFVKKPGAKSKFYGFPVVKIGVIYVLLQVVVGIVLILLNKYVPMWIAVILYSIALALSLLGFISVDAVVKEIERQDVKIKINVNTMRSLQSKVNQLVNNVEGKENIKLIKKLAEEFKYSDPVSNDSLIEIENDLNESVNDLEKAIISNDYESLNRIIKNTSSILSERNRLCKLNK